MKINSHQFQHYWVWLIPTVVLVVAGFFSLANVDSIRDLIEARRIALGQDLPLLGPEMAFSFPNGPWWFYLMSLVAGTQFGWLFTSVFTALLNALKYYFSYRLGCVLGDKSLGILMVVCMLLINFTAMQVITFTHTNLVETIMLAVMLAVFRSEVHGKFSWVLLGILCGLAFHVHPTAFLVGFFVFILWVSNPNKFLNGALFVVGFNLVFIPLIIHELLPDQGLVPGVMSYADKHFTNLNLNGLSNLFAALVYVGPYSQMLPVFGKAAATALASIQCVAVLIGLVSSVLFWRISDSKLKNFSLQLWLFFLLSCIGLLLIRENTPWYMTYGVNLTMMLITAIGIYQLCKTHDFNKHMAIFGLWTLSVFLVFHVKLISDLNQEEVIVTSGSLHDVKGLNTDLSPTSYEIAAFRGYKHGQFTCENKPTALHGPYSHLIYSRSGVEHLSHCGGQGLIYGPDKSAFNVIGVPRSFQVLINVDPIHHIGSTYFYSPIDISNDQTPLEEDFLHDYERSHDFKRNKDFESKTTQLKGGSHLIVTNLLGFRMRSEVTEVLLNGNVIDPSNANGSATLYVCSGSNCLLGNNQWTVRYKESIEGMTNIVSF